MKNAKRNWKTTTAGIAALFFLGVNIASDPKAYQDEAKQMQAAAVIATGVGLIFGKDADKTGTASEVK